MFPTLLHHRSLKTIETSNIIKSTKKKVDNNSPPWKNAKKKSHKIKMHIRVETMQTYKTGFTRI